MAIVGACAIPAILTACSKPENATRTTPGEMDQDSSPAESNTGASNAGESKAGGDAAPNNPANPEAAKLTKAAAQYQEQPKGNQQCSNCLHFEAESGTCKLVQGSIAPEAWCILWAPSS